MAAGGPIRSDGVPQRPVPDGLHLLVPQGQLLHHGLTPPTPVGPLDKFMATTFIDAVRDCLKAGGYGRKEADAESSAGFLVEVRGRLFEIASDYQVGEPADLYAACGCGDDVALGSLYATDFLPPRPRVRMALMAAEHHSGGVRGPFTILSTR